jgi:hypothetical protein
VETKILCRSTLGYVIEGVGYNDTRVVISAWTMLPRHPAEVGFADPSRGRWVPTSSNRQEGGILHIARAYFLAYCLVLSDRASRSHPWCFPFVKVVSTRGGRMGSIRGLPRIAAKTAH